MVASPRSDAVHLVFLIHGLWGGPQHLAAAKDELRAAWVRQHGVRDDSASVRGPEEDPLVEEKVVGRDGEDLVIVVAGGMTSKLTYDGIDVCASRVAWEVDEEVARLQADGKRVDKFSVVRTTSDGSANPQMGYSLVVARYLVGLLNARTPSFFDEHRAVSFATIASPHLGIPRYMLVWLGSRMLSRSGEQLYVADRYSDEDPRPLLEIMADPRLVFYQALQRFQSIQIIANAVQDHTVPYPSAAIETTDQFVQWQEQGLQVDVDEERFVQSVTVPKAAMLDDQGKQKTRRVWGSSIGTLPPVLRARFPYNYIILVLLPIMLPLILLLASARFLLDSRRSRLRLQRLARISTSGDQSTRSPIPSSSGLSIDGLRQAIRRVERGLEQPLVSYSNEIETLRASAEPNQVSVKVRMKESQLRMAIWLNTLNLTKRLVWLPEVANSHAVVVVRNPIEFPIHEKGRSILQRWARTLVEAT